MGITVSVIVGCCLTLPISSAAICIMLGIDGLAAGAATAGCCAQMIGFAVISYRDNGMGGLIYISVALFEDRSITVVIRDRGCGIADVAQARQVAMFLAKQHTKSPLTVIGSSIGGRNHATVLHSCKAVADMMDTDKTFKAQIEEIEKIVLNKN